MVGLEHDGIIIKTKDTDIKITKYIYDGNIKVGDTDLNERLFIIAEAGVNHNGDLIRFRDDIIKMQSSFRHSKQIHWQQKTQSSRLPKIIQV